MATARLQSNNSFKPTPHRGVNSVLCATLHAVATPPRGGLTQALGLGESMSWTEKEIFSGDDIIEPSVLVSEHRFNLPDIPTSVRVRIYRHHKGPDDSRFAFETSHLIHTPEQMGPYSPGAPWYDDPQYALHRAVDSIVSYYRAAVSKGHVPSADWLVPNTFF
jgi:hypothetical protein